MPAGGVTALLLAPSVSALMIQGFRLSGACAASLLLPLSPAGFAALLDGLFHD